MNPHEITDTKPMSMVFGTAVCSATCFSGHSPDKDEPTTYSVADLMDRLQVIHHSALQGFKVVSDRIKPRYDRLSSSA